MKKYLDRTLDWEESLDRSSRSLSIIQAQLPDLLSDLRTLRDIARRYEARWKRYPAKESASASRLQDVTSVLSIPLDDFENARRLIDDTKMHLELIERSELPKGYGRDGRQRPERMA